MTSLVAFTEIKHATGYVPFLSHSIAYTSSLLREREQPQATAVTHVTSCVA